MSRARRLCSLLALGVAQFELKGEGAEGKAEKRAEETGRRRGKGSAAARGGRSGESGA